MNLLEARNLAKHYTNGAVQTHALKRIDFTILRGEFVSIVGPSGCGKTTLLKLIAGLLLANNGEILLHGQVVEGPPKGLILLFQDYSRSLLPWRTVLQNVCYGLELKRQGKPKEEIAAKALHYLEAVGLKTFAQHYPWQLSGGMQQRVAISRALACEPEVLLMDEPFGSLDAQTRAELEDGLLELWTHFHQTILFVTHDIDEAIYLSDRVLVLSASPAVILSEQQIGLERPRHQLKSKGAANFHSHRQEIYHQIRGLS